MPRLRGKVRIAPCYAGNANRRGSYGHHTWNSPPDYQKEKTDVGKRLIFGALPFGAIFKCSLVWPCGDYFFSVSA